LETISEQVLDAVRKAAVEGTLPCAEAWKIADAQGVSLLIVGSAANKLGVKIRKCQLGCF